MWYWFFPPIHLEPCLCNSQLKNILLLSLLLCHQFCPHDIWCTHSSTPNTPPHRPSLHFFLPTFSFSAGGNPSSCLTAVDEVRHYVTECEQVRQPALTSFSINSSSEAGTEKQAACRGHIQYLWSFCSTNLFFPLLCSNAAHHLVNQHLENKNLSFCSIHLLKYLGQV